jgi:hypothetical protein
MNLPHILTAAMQDRRRVTFIFRMTRRKHPMLTVIAVQYVNQSGIIRFTFRHNRLYILAAVTPRPKPVRQIGDGQQAISRERAAARRDHQERVRRRHIGPPCSLAARTASHSHHAGGPGPHPSSAGARRTRSRGHTADGTDGSPVPGDTGHLDRV